MYVHEALCVLLLCTVGFTVQTCTHAISSCVSCVCVCVCRYYSVSDPGSWINVGENKGELKVANTIDLESPLVTNTMYNITIKAVDKSE